MPCYYRKITSTSFLLFLLQLFQARGLETTQIPDYSSHDHHAVQASWEGFFQGDMKFDDSAVAVTQHLNSTRSLNSATLQKWDDYIKNDYYWIRIYIDNSYTAYEESLIKDALRTLQWTAKVIKFQFLSSKPNNNNRNSYIHVKKSGGCWSYYGRKNDAHLGQTLSLDSECLNQRTIHHVFLHALGFCHEINRPDRDNFVSINYENIASGYETEFTIMEDINTLGVPFDYKSVMMFGPNTFSKSMWLNTIESKTSTAIDISRDRASWWDLIQIRLLYQCISNQGSATRTFAQYKNQKCNWNCKCWKKAAGCNAGGDGYCKSGLVCRRNVCVDP